MIEHQNLNAMDENQIREYHRMFLGWYGLPKEQQDEILHILCHALAISRIEFYNGKIIE